jgi:hypothetical protein
MAISGTTTDYTGRTVDILIMGGVNPLSPEIQQDSLTFGSPSQYVTGIQKLIQRYAINMMTILGSQTNYPSFGTNFVQGLLSVAGLTTNAATHLFNFGNMKIISEFRLYQAANPSMPLDEQLDTATLLSFNSTGDTINIQIAITSLAGENVVFVLPLPLTP